MGKCGSVLSAEYVLEQIYKEDAAEKIEEFEECYCRACVRDAAKILEEMI